jgi:hypothetical protein
MPLPVEHDEPSDPIDVSLLAVDAVVVVQPPDDAADLIEQHGLGPRRRRILMSVHAVFPYGGARAPLNIPLLGKALRALPKPPPRYNTAPTRPASAPYGPAAYSGARSGRSRC